MVLILILVQLKAYMENNNCASVQGLYTVEFQFVFRGNWQDHSEWIYQINTSLVFVHFLWPFIHFEWAVDLRCKNSCCKWNLLASKWQMWNFCGDWGKIVLTFAAATFTMTHLFELRSLLWGMSHIKSIKEWEAHITIYESFSSTCVKYPIF